MSVPLVPRRRGFDRLRSSRRTHTRALATRVWVPRSSVDHRIATHARCHLHDPPAGYPPAVQSISRGDPARVAALRVGVLTGSRLFSTGQIHCGSAQFRSAPTWETPVADNRLSPCTKMRRRVGLLLLEPLYNDNAQRSGAGWATARDRFPGRVDRASAGRGDGTAGHRDSVVNRRATSPDPRPQASVFAISRSVASGRIFLAAASPDRDRKRACPQSPGSHELIHQDLCGAVLAPHGDS